MNPPAVTQINIQKKHS